MDRSERLYRINSLLTRNRTVSVESFLENLEISRATFKRDLEYLRERLHAPILWDREARGYRLAASSPDAPVYALPGLWFTASEVYALLVAHKVLSEIEPGILASHIEPLLSRLKGLMESAGHPAVHMLSRVRLLSMWRRPVDVEHFSIIAHALLERTRIHISAYNRTRDQTIDRSISPQRLIHYRDNWYIDAWCHVREQLRTFAIENIIRVHLEGLPAVEIAEEEMDVYFSSSYGIFAGFPTDRATLRFTPERAKWVRSEMWHPLQHGEALADGSYRLEIPYGDPRELLMDILRHGPHVVVESPNSLAELVRAEAHKIIRRYKEGSEGSSGEPLGPS